MYIVSISHVTWLDDHIKIRSKLEFCYIYAFVENR